MPGSPNYRFSTALLALGLLMSGSELAAAGDQLVVEVFTSKALPVATDVDLDSASVILEVYEVDGMEQLEAELSRGLPRDPEVAKRNALSRIGTLGDAEMQDVQRAAIGLSTAMQYGINRTPAIVFDRHAIVYGTTKLGEALHRYRQWQQASSR